MFDKMKKSTEARLSRKLCGLVGEGDLSDMKKLLDKGADANALVDDRPVLHHFICDYSYFSSYRLSRVTFLISAGADIEATDRMGNTALLAAAKSREWAIAQNLIDSGANVEVKDKSGVDFIHYASHFNQWSLCEMLLDRGIGASILVDPERGVLSRIISSDRTRVSLIEKIMALPGFDINAGEIPVLHSVVQAGYDLDTILKHPDININILSHQNETVLQTALRAGREERLIDRLVELGVNIRHRPVAGLSALDNAVAGGDIAKVRQIIGHIQKTSQDGDNDIYNKALLTAEENNSAQMIEALLEVGADINTQDRNGKTALMRAIEKRSTVVVKFLLNKGADVSIYDSSGLTARDYAARSYESSVYTPLVDEAACRPTGPLAITSKDKRFIRHGDAALEVCDSVSLSTIFNFQTQQVLYRDGAAMTAQNFDSVQGQDAIIKAHEKLREMGGAPPELQLLSARKKKAAIKVGQVS